MKKPSYEPPGVLPALARPQPRGHWHFRCPPSRKPRRVWSWSAAASAARGRPRPESDRAGLQVTLVEPNPTFTACPFSNSVIAGLRSIEAQQFGYDKSPPAA